MFEGLQYACGAVLNYVRLQCRTGACYGRFISVKSEVRVSSFDCGGVFLMESPSCRLLFGML